MSLYKLSTLDEPAWDRTALRRDIDLIGICDRILRDMDESSAYRRQKRPAMAMPPGQHSSSADADIFGICTRLIAPMRNTWAAELGVLQMNAANPAAEGLSAQNGFVNSITSGSFAAPINLMEDAWLTDIFNISWE